MALEIVNLIINDVAPGASTRIIPLQQGKYFVGPLNILPGRLDVVITAVALSHDPWTNTILLNISFDSAEAGSVNLSATIACSDDHVIGGDGIGGISFTSNSSFDVGD